MEGPLANQVGRLVVESVVLDGVLSQQQQLPSSHETSRVELGVPEHPVVVEAAVNKRLHVHERVDGDDSRGERLLSLLHANDLVVHPLLLDEAKMSDEEADVGEEKDTAWENVCLLSFAVKEESSCALHLTVH